MIPGAVIQPDRTVKSGIEVLLGSQFTGSVGDVPTQGSSLRVTQNPQSNETVDLPNDLSVTNGAGHLLQHVTRFTSRSPRHNRLLAGCE